MVELVSNLQASQYLMLTAISRAFAKARTIRDDSDSEDDMTQIQAQRRGLQKRSVPLARSERRAAEGREFATPPPNEHGLEQASISSNTITHTRILNTLSNVRAQSELSDLSLPDDSIEESTPMAPVMSNEVTMLDLTLATSSSTLSASVSSTNHGTSMSTETPSESLPPATSKPKRKGRTPASTTAAKKTRRGKVANGF